MKLKLIAALSLMGAASSFGASGIFGSYLEITTSSTTVYQAQSAGGSSPSLQGQDFGTFQLSDTLTISNASVNTFKNGGSDVSGAVLNYRLFETSSTPGSFNTIALNFGNNATFTDLGGNEFTGGGDQDWRGAATFPVDLISAAGSAGSYSLEVFYTSSNTDGTAFSNNGGANYTSTFTVVPEPSAALLGAIGSLLLLRRRR